MKGMYKITLQYAPDARQRAWAQSPKATRQLFSARLRLQRALCDGGACRTLGSEKTTVYIISGEDLMYLYITEPVVKQYIDLTATCEKIDNGFI